MSSLADIPCKAPYSDRTEVNYMAKLNICYYNVRLKHDAYMAVLASVKKVAEIFPAHNKLSGQVIKRNSSLSVSDRISAKMRSIDMAQKSWIALYDKYAEVKLEKRVFSK